MKRFLLCCLLVGGLWIAQAATYVVSVGIADYQNIKDLRFPEKDAVAMANVYKTHTQNVVTITGRNATRANILRSLNNQFGKASSGDMVVFFFSGHGFEGGFCPYDTRGNSNLLSYNDIYAVFRNCKASRKVVIADACMAGGMRREKKNSHGTPSKSSNVILFLSSRTDEYSFEKPNMTNGLFTTYVSMGLRGKADVNRDRIVTAKELFDYVSREVKRASNNQQHPVMWGHFDDNFVMMNWR